MSTADRVAVFLEVLGEGTWIQTFYEVHGLSVQLLNRLPDVSGRSVVVRVSEPLAPVAEIGRNDEQALWTGQVRGQNSAINSFFFWTERSYKYGHDGEFVLVAVESLRH